MGVHSYQDLKLHVGHNIVCVAYHAELEGGPANIAIECVDCYEVLMDFDRPDMAESEATE